MMKRYVALLRGINVGGKMVSMERLKNSFESLGFTHVKTLHNSGNVVFGTSQTNPKKVQAQIEATIKKEFCFEVQVLVVTHDDICKLVESNPFKKIKITPQTLLHVTFLFDPPTKNTLKIPYESPEKDFKLLFFFYF